jgi:hypothetical protein
MIQFFLMSFMLINASISIAQSNAIGCGLSGTVDERIQDCRSNTNQKEGFSLVSQNTSGHYLILEEKTNLIWSQLLFVEQQFQFYGKVDINTIHSICKRFQPFSLASKKEGWRLPTIKELRRTTRHRNKSGGAEVLSSNTKIVSRLVYNGYGYTEEFKSVPVSYSEYDRKKYSETGSLKWNSYRCVIDKSFLN